MPTIVVIWLAKLSARLTRLLGRGEGSALPGLVAERLQPNLLGYFGGQLGGHAVLVTGTNGKTTTTRMIVAALQQASDGQILTNRAGSNLTRGLLSTLVANSNWRGRLRARQAVFEVDEASFPKVFSALGPKTVVVLNLFRDQLDRYGELNTLAAKLRDALKANSASRLVLNGDDPLVAWLGLGLANASYFGLSEAKVKKLAHDYAADSNACPVCNCPLSYQKLYYAHIGHYRCNNKDFKTPLLDVVGSTTKVNLNESTSVIKIGTKTARLNLELPGLYNVYNALAAITVADALGLGLTSTVASIEHVPAAFGRAEVVQVGDRRVQLLLVKNPTGFNQVIQTYLQSSDHHPLLILVNDLIADGRDVSWLWDVAFEDLDTKQPIVVSGTRAYDLALRLKYAELKFDLQISAGNSIEHFLDSLPAGQTGIILPTYTAMLEVRRELAKITEVARMGS